jgi:hypothetical protein
MIDHDKLLNFPIPEVRQRLAKRDSILYALSVGLGQDPTDARQLDFVDHHRALKALPSMAVVLGHPGFWLADPETGVDAVRVAHGEQAITLHRPLPVQGEVIGRTRVTGIVDKGAGKGALLYSEKRVLDAASGALLAVTTSTTFLRGDGGFGGPAGPVKPAAPVPEGRPMTRSTSRRGRSRRSTTGSTATTTRCTPTRRSPRGRGSRARSCTASARSASFATPWSGRLGATTRRGSGTWSCASPPPCSPARRSARRSGGTGPSGRASWSATWWS